MAGVALILKDLPPEVHFCYDSSRFPHPDCQKTAPDRFRVDPCVTCRTTYVTQPNDATLHLDTRGAVKRLHLSNLDICRGATTLKVFADHGHCLDPTQNGDAFSNLLINDLFARRVQFEYASSDSLET